MKYFKVYLSLVGKFVMVSDGIYLLGLYSSEQKYNKNNEEITEKSDLAVFDKTGNWLDRYFAGKKPEIGELELKPVGSEFQRGVWEILCKIPYGQVTTYGAIAKEIAAKRNKNKMSAQAVGGAVGSNPIGVIIPCHRVIGLNGNLTGYAGGLDKKAALLKHEGLDMTRMFMPKIKNLK